MLFFAQGSKDKEAGALSLLVGQLRVAVTGFTREGYGWGLKPWN